MKKVNIAPLGDWEKEFFNITFEGLAITKKSRPIKVYRMERKK